MAQGIRQGIEAVFFASGPKMCGKLVAKAEADWVAQKKNSPTLLLWSCLSYVTRGFRGLFCGSVVLD